MGQGNKGEVLDYMEVLGVFGEIEDPRSSPAKKHNFQEMLFIALSAILAGAEGFTDMEFFAKSKQSWLVLLRVCLAS